MNRFLFATVVCALAAASAHATIISSTPPNVTVTIGTVGDTTSAVLTYVDNLDGTFSSTGNYSGTGYNFNWDLTVKEDPFISGLFSVQNNTAVVQTYIVAVSLPIAPPQVPFTVHGGSIGMTLTDSNFNGVGSVTDAGVAAYQGQIDGVTVLDLFDVPFALNIAFAGQSVTTSDFAGLPGPTLPSGPALSTIGIVHTFKLTPGDSASLTSFFVVEAIPEFGSLGLAACGVLAGICIRVLTRREPA
ncbi:MAG: hypothetical protein K1X57_22085 [Gemmataceae bacterium]|nr:hypothetical protein [Gemmataceae bacterium]